MLRFPAVIHGSLEGDSSLIPVILPIPLLVSLIVLTTLFPGLSPTSIPLGSVIGIGTAGLKFNFTAAEVTAPSELLKSIRYSAVSSASRGALKLTTTPVVSPGANVDFKFVLSIVATTLLFGFNATSTALMPVSVFPPSSDAFLIFITLEKREFLVEVIETLDGTATIPIILKSVEAPAPRPLLYANTFACHKPASPNAG